MASIDQFIAAAASYRGVPYFFGGTSRQGIDCSGLVWAAARAVGVNVPRTSQDQYAALPHVPANQIRPGDLIFSAGTDGSARAPGHVGIYVGSDRILEASHTGTVVHVLPYDTDYKARTVGIGRIPALSGGGTGSVIPIGAGDTSPQGSSGGDGGGGSIFQIPAEIANFFGEALKLFTAFFKPSTYVRIGAGLFGTILLVAGLWFLVKSAVGQP